MSSGTSCVHVDVAIKVMAYAKVWREVNSCLRSAENVRDNFNKGYIADSSQEIEEMERRGSLLLKSLEKFQEDLVGEITQHVDLRQNEDGTGRITAEAVRLREMDGFWRETISIVSDAYRWIKRLQRIVRKAYLRKCHRRLVVRATGLMVDGFIQRWRNSVHRIKEGKTYLLTVRYVCVFCKKEVELYPSVTQQKIVCQTCYHKDNLPQ